MEKKTVIITGADGNLGSATVKKFLEQGDNIVAVFGGPKPVDLDETICSIENCDLTNPDYSQEIINTTCDKFSDPDILINIVGGFIWKEIKDTTIEDFDRQFNLNFKTMYNMTMATLAKISNSKNGRIINIGAMGAMRANAGMAAYAISKAAVMHFTEALAEETANNITVNAILPSIIDTPQNRVDMPGSDFTKWVTAAELVDLILFLSSNESSAVNGSLLPAAGRL